MGPSLHRSRPSPAASGFRLADNLSRFSVARSRHVGCLGLKTRRSAVQPLAHACKTSSGQSGRRAGRFCWGRKPPTARPQQAGLPRALPLVWLAKKRKHRSPLPIAVFFPTREPAVSLGPAPPPTHPAPLSPAPTQPVPRSAPSSRPAPAQPRPHSAPPRPGPAPLSPAPLSPAPAQPRPSSRPAPLSPALAQALCLQPAAPASTSRFPSWEGRPPPPEGKGLFCSRTSSSWLEGHLAQQVLTIFSSKCGINRKSYLSTGGCSPRSETRAESCAGVWDEGLALDEEPPGRGGGCPEWGPLPT